MRTYDTLIQSLLFALALTLSGPALAAAPYTSAGEAYKAGVSAIEARRFPEAFEALEWAAARDEEAAFFAKFALAQLYSSDALPFVDHAKAYRLYAELGDRYRDADSFYDRRAPYVARAIVAVALYKASGLPAAGLAADVDGAVQDLDYANKFFDDMDAQLELVKLWLKDDRDPSKFRQARDLLAKLAREKGHPGAQATLAEMFFDGDKKLGRRPSLALAFATLAVEGAYEDDRLWIDSVYHRIFCDTAAPVRERAKVIADRFRKDKRIVEAIREARRQTAIGKIVEQDAETFGGALTWVCANGETVAWPKRAGDRQPLVEALTASTLPSGEPEEASALREDAMGAGLNTFRPASESTD
jgi:hypothetical protein